jgi:hypothetical protein
VAVDVAKAIGSVVPDEEQNFLQAWRSHGGDFVSYAVAAKGKDAAGKKKAVGNLLAYAKQQGVFFSNITGGALPSDAVEKSYATHIASLAGHQDGR